jgi:hypothetical protein
MSDSETHQWLQEALGIFSELAGISKESSVMRADHPEEARLTMLMGSGFLGSSIRRRLGDIPVLNLKDLSKARKKE